MPRKTIDDTIIKKLQQHRQENPQDTVAHMARIFKISIPSVNLYSSHIISGEIKSISELRNEIRQKHYTKVCVECGDKITRRATRCKVCYKRNNPSAVRYNSSLSNIKTKALEICEKAPKENPYHYFLIDNISHGSCKHCKMERLHNSGDAITAADTLISFSNADIVQWSR